MLTTINKNLQEYTVCRFGGPKAPPVIKPPLSTAAASNVSVMNDYKRKPQGAASTILTSGQGVSNQTSKKTILGG